jgi:serine/threonine-protein kinase
MRAGSRITTPSSGARARWRGWTRTGAAFAVLGLVAGLALLVFGGDAGEGDAGEGGGERRVEASSLVQARPGAGAALDAAVATTVLSLRSTPPGALVRIGDQVLGTTPVEISTLAPRVQHTLRLSKRGWAPGTVTVQLAPGEAREHEVTLSRRRALPARTIGAAAPAAAQRRGGKGTLSINTKPWTQVSIDGKPRGTTPLIKLELSSGVHKVRLVNPQAGIDQRRSVRVEPQQHQKLNLDLR